MSWKQFSIYGKGANFNLLFPTIFYYRNRLWMERWHFLFEPQLLVRFESGNHVSVLSSAQEIAKELNLKFQIGDIAKSSPSKSHGEDFYGEQGFYGSSDLWEANADFMDAACRIAIMTATGKDSKTMQRKHIHLLCNIFGKHYGTESNLLRFSANRAAKLFKEIGKQ